jgi:hypothetical protein
MAVLAAGRLINNAMDDFIFSAPLLIKRLFKILEINLSHHIPVVKGSLMQHDAGLHHQ